jgi:hypothetical protein
MARIVTRGEDAATAFRLDPDSEEEPPQQPSVNVRRSNLRRRINRNRQRQQAPVEDSNDSAMSADEPDEPPAYHGAPPKGFEDFANVTKTQTQDYDDESSEASSMQGFAGPTPPLHEQTRSEAEIPRAPFSTIEEEKQDILLKFKRLRDKNIKLSQAYGPHSSITELRSEMDTLRRNAEMEGSVKFQRRALIAICSGLEWANKRWDPFNLALDGWSETIAEDIESYDPTFEKLHAKYSGKASLPPEAELFLSLAGSAFSFHLTNQFFKSALGGGGPSGASSSSDRPNSATMAGIFEKLQKEMSQAQKPAAPQPPSAPVPPASPMAPVPPVPPVPPMQAAQVMLHVPTNFIPNPVNTSEENRPRIMEINDTDSEDSVSVSSVTSVGTSVASESQTKQVTVRPTTRAGRGRGRGRATGGRGITI